MAMSTSTTAVRAGYQPLPSGVFIAPFAARAEDVEPALAGLRAVLRMQSSPDETAAIVVEPVLGEGGYLCDRSPPN